MTAGADPADAGFWAAVEQQDLSTLAGELRLGGQEAALGSVLPALSAWRKRRGELATLDTWRYRVTWKPLSGLPAPELSGTWLIVGGPAASAGFCADTLRELGADPVVLPGDGDRTDLSVRLRRAVTEPYALGGILSLQDDPAGTVTLIQALSDAALAAPVWLLTTGAVSTGPGDPVTAPGRAQVWGLGRAFGLEEPGRWGGLIDLPADLDAAARERLAAALTGIGDEDQLAIRPSGVYARRLVRSPLGDTAPKRSWTPSGTILLTGGTGAIGGHVARWLAAAAAVPGSEGVRLVLTSRRGLDAPGAADLRDELSALGARVTIAACDVADRDALAALLGELTEQGEPVRSVFHAAGIASASPIADLDLGDLREVVAAKTAGATNLDALLPDLEAFVLFSSNAGVWGGGGQGAYGAGNAYLDALAEHRRAHGRHATSVAWGVWAGGGMSGGDTAGQLGRRGLAAMPPETAIAALRQALDHDETSLAVADVDWGRFAPSFFSARPRPLLHDLPEVADLLEAERDAGPSMSGAAALRERLAGLAQQERDRVLVEMVCAEAAAVLGYASSHAIQPERAFRELGFDSPTAIEVRNRLNVVTGLRLPTTLLFDHPTPTALADYIHGQLFGQGAADDLAEMEARVRQALATVPLARFRDAGLMDAFLRLAGIEDTPAAPAEHDGALIDDMDADSLIQMALDNADTRS
ncbi:SDR family NAD(P)-dependent oxidoreductase [Nonomuraea sp. NBC_01738]|nr:SDR family NAD(P)-dependent oxidoreductase [Nonomuraea sp. NBC_01738]